MLDTQPETARPDQLDELEPRGAWIAVLFAATSLLGAALMFMVQPLAAKLILPSFGGSATVWSTSSLFFQVLLLVGYVYAHISSRRLGAWWQPRMHVLVLLVPLLFLPVTLPLDAAPAADSSPVLWLLRTLILMVGVPFVVLSATGPLIQRWYSWSRGPRADDPYFLFAGSNLGSFIGLLSYPFVLEPLLSLTQQRWLWSILMCAFIVLMVACACVVRAPRVVVVEEVSTPGGAGPVTATVLTWCGLAFLPSCIMLAVTAHISTDVAPIPLVWVVPLALYLLSFIAAFARTSRRPPMTLTRVAVASAVLSGVISLAGPALPIWLIVVVDLMTVTLVSFAAHARLAATRPGAEHLTLFYLVISIGGAIGGVVNGFVAPLLTNRVWEYGLSLAAVPLLLIGIAVRRRTWISHRYNPAFRTVALTLVTCVVLVTAAVLMSAVASNGTIAIAAAVGMTATLAWLVSHNPTVLSLCLAAGTAALGVQAMTSSIALERTFYGSYRLVDADGQHRLIHGTTVHGTQFKDARRTEPTAYYAEAGPLGGIMGTLDHQRTAVVGLGAGAIATYGRRGDHFTFFEIDPVIEDLATNPDYFSYLPNSAAEVDVVVGDGRLKLAEQPAGTFDLIVLDAFSSDSIPVHLLTTEAMREYVDRLAPGGSLVVHISNRIFDLEPVLAASATDLGWQAARGVGSGDSDGDEVPSKWIAITPNAEAAHRLVDLPGWSELLSTDPVTWTDNYASVLSVLQ
ncbi:spermidine synthase [Nocardioides sp. T5]|uniref:spermidine synthase n=1 Tax=Nocardioides sp. T5 TaxID=3400182 RepID=UPI003A8686CB